PRPGMAPPRPFLLRYMIIRFPAKSNNADGESRKRKPPCVGDVARGLGPRACRPQARALAPSEAETEPFRHAGAIGGIGLGEVRDLAALDLLRHALHRVGDVGHQPLALVRLQEAEQGAGLAVVVVAGA